MVSLLKMCDHPRQRNDFINLNFEQFRLRLSKLTRDTGTATSITFTFINLYLFFQITLSIYGLLSQISEGFGTKDIGLFVTAASNICLLFVICDEAHNASQAVRTNFQKKLLMVELSWMNTDAQVELTFPLDELKPRVFVNVIFRLRLTCSSELQK